MKSPESYKISTHRINLNFLESLDRKQKKAFALLLLIKNRFTNSFVYDYNPTSLSGKVNASRYQCESLVSEILANQWGRINSHGNLRLFALKPIMSYPGVKGWELATDRIRILSSDTLNEVIDKIDILILQRNLNKQDFAMDVKSYSQIGQDESELSYKQWLRIRRKKYHWYYGAFIDIRIIGMRRLGEILKCSTSKAGLFIQRMVKKGWVKVEQVIHRLNHTKDSTIPTEFLQSTYGYRTTDIKTGSMYVHMGSNIQITVPW